mgnify:CR=1 FL=1
MTRTLAKRLVICVDNDGYQASLEMHKIYVELPDSHLGKQGLMRVIDESGEDYLYPKILFRAVALPLSIRRREIGRAHV